jgi:hypothetical protein
VIELKSKHLLILNVILATYLFTINIIQLDINSVIKYPENPADIIILLFSLSFFWIPMFGAILITITFSIKGKPWKNTAKELKTFYRLMFTALLAFSFSEIILEHVGFFGGTGVRTFFLVMFLIFYLKYSEPYLSKALENGGLMWKEK